MKYLKQFETEAGYASYKSGSDYITPNVSYVVENNIVNYNPYEVQETRLVCTYNITDTTNRTQVCQSSHFFTSMEVDGVLLDSIITHYPFDTIGEHTVKFETAKPTTIEKQAFSYCPCLTSIVIPNSFTYIDEYAFSNCTGLTSVNIGSGVTKIGMYAFQKCSNLTSVNIGSGVTKIDNYAFSNCTGLTSITIPDSVTSIGSNAFYGCESLPVENNLRYADTYLVGVIDNSLSTYNIKEGTKWIGNAAFKKCSNLTSITIPESITSIGYQAFSSCKGLTSITIPESITSIGYQAFSYCSGLTSITIGSGVTSIGYGTFQSCSNLNEIICYAPVAPSILTDTFQYIKSGGILYVPTGSDYSSWMSTGDYYLGKYNWTIEYI